MLGFSLFLGGWEKNYEDNSLSHEMFCLQVRDLQKQVELLVVERQKGRQRVLLATQCLAPLKRVRGPRSFRIFVPDHGENGERPFIRDI